MEKLQDGLNGLRAIAALSVIIAHTSLEGLADFGLLHLFDLPMAGFGVTLFFVISGFLTTYLLLHEVEKQATVDVKKFYLRRILRIWPIYYLFIIVGTSTFFILGKLHNSQFSSMWFYIFFAANIPFIFNHGITILVHYWSIGVEEQFYLFWPWIVRFSKNKLLNMAILIFIVLSILKIIFWYFIGRESFEYRFLAVTRFNCMMIGVIGAILYFNKNLRFENLFSNKIIQSVSWMLFLLMGLNIIYIPSIIGNEVIAFASLSMIIGQITVKKRIINLENKLFDFIGKISYGIYVIHPLIIMLLSILYKSLDINVGLKYMLVYSSVLIITILVAWISFNYFEKVFLNLKTKFAIVPSLTTIEKKQ